VLTRLTGARIGVVGEHPDGFPTCAYDPVALEDLAGIEVDRIDLPEVFQAAAKIPLERVEAVRRRALETLAGVDELEQEPLEKSLRVYAALRDLAGERGFDALAVRCWPEFFTEYGCAACGAMAMLSEDGVPCACEADAHGNVSSLMLQAAAGEPAFLVDLVDIDRAGNTGVLWHCGLAPISMADPADAPRATIHSNRRKPLLQEFALKPGRVTLARFSRARNRPKMAIGGAEMLRAPKSFSGTSGVVRFDRPAHEVLDCIIGEGLEHHLSFAYGDHREALCAAAAALGLPVLELC
jgi:L-fucose isomerase-like protein